MVQNILFQGIPVYHISRQAHLSYGWLFAYDISIIFLYPAIWGFLKMEDPQVTIGFNTKMVEWLGWFGGAAILGNLHIGIV